MIWSLLSAFVFISISCTVRAQDEPEITQNILPDIKRVGETGKLNCTVTRQANNKVFWIHDSIYLSSDDAVDIEEIHNPLLDDGSPKYDVEKVVRGDTTTYTLIIRRLELNDAGIYTCEVLIRGQENKPNKDGQIIVLSPPTIVLYKTTQTITITEGDNVDLNCDATGYPRPKISWIRPNGKPIPTINKYTYMDNDRKGLMLRDVQKDDRGVYRCIADNDVRPPAMFDTTLYVNFKPFARPVQTTYGQAQNRLFDIVIECRVEGFPDPDLRWYKVIADGLQPISDDDKHVIHILISHGQELSVSEFWFQLKILNVQANDYGKYVCEGSNKLGNHQAIVELYETSECQGPNCPPEVFASGAASVLAFFSVLFTTLLTILVLH